MDKQQKSHEKTRKICGFLDYLSDIGANKKTVILFLTGKRIVWYVGLGIATSGIGFMVAGTLPNHEIAIPANSQKTGTQEH
ncbi:hypothetical protein [Nostoc sp.]